MTSSPLASHDEVVQTPSMFRPLQQYLHSGASGAKLISISMSAASNYFRAATCNVILIAVLDDH